LASLRRYCEAICNAATLCGETWLLKAMGFAIIDPDRHGRN
jgi:hypothetical protein